MKECGSQIILSNTYHLLVQPGGEAIEKVQQGTWSGREASRNGRRGHREDVVVGLFVFV